MKCVTQTKTLTQKYRVSVFVLAKYLFQVPHHPLQSTTSPSSKYHTTLFKLSHHHLQSSTHISSKYHTTLFKLSHHLLQSTYCMYFAQLISNETKTVELVGGENGGVIFLINVSVCSNGADNTGDCLPWRGNSASCISWYC